MRYFPTYLLCLVVSVVLAGPAAAAELQTAIRPAPEDELFTRTTVPSIEIEIPAAGMEVLRRYDWRNVSEDSPREDVRATVREGNTVYTNVAVHLKGSAGSFRPIDFPTPALTLNFDKFAKGQRFHGLQKVHLNNSVQDRSFISEVICRELFARAGIPVPRASHIVSSLNGRGPELYVILEGWNKQFLKRHFKNVKGNLYDGGFAKDVTYPIEVQSGENPEDRTRLIELANAATDRVDRPTRLREVLDIDRFVDFLAMEILIVHWDGYGMNRNNYRVFHDLDSNKMVFLPHGLDQMFGQWRSSPQSRITPMMKGVVARAAMSDPSIRRRYLERMGVLLTNALNYSTITNRAQELTRRIQPHLLKNLNALANQDLAASAFCDRIEHRIKSVREQLAKATSPLQFDNAGEAQLSDWRSSFESGSPQFPRRRDDSNTLRVSANGNLAYGSWRTIVLLEEGRYQLTGRVRTQNLVTNNVSRGGVSLRISGAKDPKMTGQTEDWTTLTYEFEVNGQSDIELVCEFRASRGTAEFESSSLKLVRKSARK